MLGRNHAVYACAAWVGMWPWLHHGNLPVIDFAESSGADPALLLVTSAVAAGAGVVPDLDHPDAHPARRFGLASRLVSKATNLASGGHRYGTHTLWFAALLGAATWAVTDLMPDRFGVWLVLAACVFCISCGLALVGPSLGFRVHEAFSLLAPAAPAVYIWYRYELVAPYLWLIASLGVLVHIACDAVTKGGVPVLWPLSDRRVSLSLFTVGKGFEKYVVTSAGTLLLLFAGWQASAYMARIV